MGGAAFALLKADGSVVSRGDPSSGGQLSRVQVSGLEINEFIGILRILIGILTGILVNLLGFYSCFFFNFGGFIGILVNEG